jgi:hypothetical protein
MRSKYALYTSKCKSIKTKKMILTHPSRTPQEQLIEGWYPEGLSTFSSEMLQLQQPNMEGKNVVERKIIDP